MYLIDGGGGGSSSGLDGMSFIQDQGSKRLSIPFVRIVENR